MNTDINNIGIVCEYIGKSQRLAIVIPKNPTADTLNSALALYLAITKIGKSVKIACDGNVNFAYPGVEKIVNSIDSDGNNLVISFPYQDGAIDKVDYKIEKNIFNLIVIPHAGFSKITPKDISYSYSGGTPDTVLALGATKPEDLGTIYTKNPQAFGRDFSFINIDSNPQNLSYAQANFVTVYKTVAQAAMEVIHALNVDFDDTTSSHLLTAIHSATVGFTDATTSVAEFESAAFLSKNGGKVIKAAVKTLPQTQAPQMQSFAQQRPQAPLQQNFAQQPKPQFNNRQNVAPSTQTQPKFAQQQNTFVAKEQFAQQPKPQARPQSNPIKQSVQGGNKETAPSFVPQKPKNWFDTLEEDFDAGTQETTSGVVNDSGPNVTKTQDEANFTNPLKPQIMGGKDFI